MVTDSISFILISESNIFLLKKFIEIAGRSLEKFRYFSIRPLSIIDSHIITVLAMENELPVAYGHLDKEKDIVWLGIAVADFAKGKGYGKKIMQYLIENGRQKKIKTIFLTVDKDNVVAIQLYKKFGFKEDFAINERSIKMRALLNE